MRFFLRPVPGASRTGWLRRPAAACLIVGSALVAGGGPARAQAPAAMSPPANGPLASADAGRGATLAARYHVRQMENVLEHAVQHAADMMRRRLASFTPDVLALAGAPRAQGFRIHGYGLFFSVEVPRLSESVTWALRVLSQSRDERVLTSLQKAAAAESDPVVRADLERAMRTIQLQYTSTPGRVPIAPATTRRATDATAPAPDPGAAGSPVSAADVGADADADADAPAAQESAAADGAPARDANASRAATMSTAPVAEPPPEVAAVGPPRDPSAAYEDEVKQALVDAMLDYAGSLQLPASEWVTVAARDAGYVAFPDAVSDMVTVTLSIRVADLADFRAQRLTREAARSRVLVREF